MICEKEYTLVVEQGVLFVWGAANLSVTGPGTASFTPDSASGNAAVGTTTEPTGNPGNFANALNFGLMTINTTAVIPCNMHIKSIYTGPGIGVDFGSGWAVAIVNNTLFANIILENGDTSTGVNINTEYDVTFNLPNTGGVDNIIEFDVNVLCGTGTGFATALQVQATFSVI
jgi:hypothetical protein